MISLYLVILYDLEHYFATKRCEAEYCTNETIDPYLKNLDDKNIQRLFNIAVREEICLEVLKNEKCTREALVL